VSIVSGVGWSSHLLDLQMSKNRVENLETKATNGIEPKWDSRRRQTHSLSRENASAIGRNKVTMLILDYTVVEMKSNTKRLLCLFVVFFMTEWEEMYRNLILNWEMTWQNIS
jgi:hypothetical protein